VSSCMPPERAHFAFDPAARDGDFARLVDQPVDDVRLRTRNSAFGCNSRSASRYRLRRGRWVPRPGAPARAAPPRPRCDGRGLGGTPRRAVLPARGASAAARTRCPCGPRTSPAPEHAVASVLTRQAFSTRVSVVRQLAERMAPAMRALPSGYASTRCSAWRGGYGRCCRASRACRAYRGNELVGLVDEDLQQLRIEVVVGRRWRRSSVMSRSRSSRRLASARLQRVPRRSTVRFAGRRTEGPFPFLHASIPARRPPAPRCARAASELWDGSRHA